MFFAIYRDDDGRWRCSRPFDEYEAVCKYADGINTAREPMVYEPSTYKHHGFNDFEETREEFIKRMLSLPFNESFEPMREMIRNDWRLIFRADVTEWATKHSKAIVAAEYSKGK